MDHIMIFAQLFDLEQSRNWHQVLLGLAVGTKLFAEQKVSANLLIRLAKNLT